MRCTVRRSTVHRRAEQFQPARATASGRVHRRALVKFDYVERLEAQGSGGYLAHRQEGARVPVSRQAGRRLRRTLRLPG